MAVDIYTKIPNQIPRAGARPLLGHPLAPKYAWIFDSCIYEIIHGSADGSNIFYGGTGSKFSPGSFLRGYAGQTLEHTATGDGSQIAARDTDVLPTVGCSIVIAYQKTDATLRDAVALTVDSASCGAGTCVCNVHIDYTDGHFYWQYGNINAGSGRLVVANSLFTYRDSIFCCTTSGGVSVPSPLGGMEIWENGSLIANQTNSASRTNVGSPVVLGNAPSYGRAGDLAKYGFIFFYHRQLSQQEAAVITTTPFVWLRAR